MANNYCTVDQVMQMFDLRTILQLSSDANQRAGELQVVQAMLDMQASELDGVLQGRYGSVPLSGTIPLVITKWVGVTAMRRFFARRNDEPKQVSSDAIWADEWIKALMENRIGLPGVSRTAIPQNVAGHKFHCDDHAATISEPPGWYAQPDSDNDNDGD